MSKPSAPAHGAPDMRLSEEHRRALLEMIGNLRGAYEDRQWGERVGFGLRPAVVVVDLALGWTQEERSLGYDMDRVVAANVEVLDAARDADVPVFFTTGSADHADPFRPAATKFRYPADADFESEYNLDPRLQRRQSEGVIAKAHDSSFKDTILGQQLHNLNIDTLIVMGCATSHCVYATCHDARDEFRVIVPLEAVGDRSELLHEVALFDIDSRMGDVMSVAEVITKIRQTS